MKYVIPFVPNSNNKYMGRTNKWEYQKDKKAWYDIMSIYCRPLVKFDKKVKVTITYYFKTKARHDSDNYSGKFINDFLVKSGIIVDDSFDCMKLNLDGYYDKDNPRTEVEIEEF